MSVKKWKIVLIWPEMLRQEKAALSVSGWAAGCKWHVRPEQRTTVSLMYHKDYKTGFILQIHFKHVSH